jgi:hypothetical protein
LLHDS